MAERKPAKESTKNSAKSATATDEKSRGFTAEERAAMKERAQELNPETRRGRSARADGESDLLAKIAAISEPDRTMAERIHALIMASAPNLSPKTWYGMPANAKGGKVVCFFQNAETFKARYATLGFNDDANLDDGAMWPTAFTLKKLTPTVEAKIAELVKRAVS